MTENKLIEKIRSVLIADATLKEYVKDRIYSSHISTIDSPEYPAISITGLDPRARFEVLEMIDMTLQIDFWFPWDKYTVDQVNECMGRVRQLLHRENLTDQTIGITVHQIFNAGGSPIMHDEVSNCLHLASRYVVTAT